MEKTVINTHEAPGAIGPYSQGIKVGNMVFISGQIPIDPQTSLMEQEDIKKATQICMNNLGAILRKAGGDYNNLVKVSIFTTDMKKFADINQVYAGYFEEDPPARAVVEVSALPKGAMVEIEGIAIL